MIDHGTCHYVIMRCEMEYKAVDLQKPKTENVLLRVLFHFLLNITPQKMNERKTKYNEESLRKEKMTTLKQAALSKAIYDLAFLTR